MQRLARYAVSDQDFIQREFPEKEHVLRGPFQRDRDRIVHSKAFRRLEYKTQVFVNHLGDNYRTRLTLSIEVAQISRSVARSLRVNEDLTETIALAHDLGHPPFGHAGERVLNRLMRPYGGFDHNEQTLRLVTLLEERYPMFAGLNLTKATLLGLRKHTRLPEDKSHSIEAQIVDICDEIAYNNHDVDDGLDSKFLKLEQLNEIDLWKEGWEKIEKEFPSSPEKIKIRYNIRSLVDDMVLELTRQTQRNIKRYQIKDIQDVIYFHKKHKGKNLVEFPEDYYHKIVELKKFLSQNLYRHPNVEVMNSKAEDIIIRIFNSLLKNSDVLPKEYLRRLEQQGIEKSISDFIAGMTDRYAIQWNENLLGKETHAMP